MGKSANSFAISLGMTLIANQALAQSQTFDIHVAAGFTAHTVQSKGGLTQARQAAQVQLDSVERRLSVASGVNYNLVIDSVFQFSSGLASQISFVPNGYDLKVIYDDAPTTPGGWYNSSRTIYHAWASTQFGGTFGISATESLVKLVGLSRGGFDLIAQQVTPSKNPISSQGFTSGNSVMNSPYGLSNMDTYNQMLLLRNGGTSGANISYALDNTFPDSIIVKATDSTGTALNGALLRLYPVATASDEVGSQFVYSDSSRSGGSFIIPAGVYGLGDPGNAYKLTRTNLLGELSYGTARKFFWMPISDVQIPKLNGPNAYKVSYSLPVKAPAAATDLGPNNGSKYLTVSGDANFYTITQFPSWHFDKVVVAFNAVNSPMNGSVYVNGNYYGQVSGWYQTITVNQSTPDPIRVQFVANNPQQISIQWWAITN